jgi:hypothetical protein
MDENVSRDAADKAGKGIEFVVSGHRKQKAAGGGLFLKILDLP